MKWILASERLPDHMVMVALLLRESNTYFGGYYDYSMKVFRVANIGPQGMKVDGVEWLDETPNADNGEDAVAKEVIGLLKFMTIEDIREGTNGQLRKYFYANGECAADSYEALYDYYKLNRPIK